MYKENVSGQYTNTKSILFKSESRQMHLPENVLRFGDFLLKLLLGRIKVGHGGPNLDK